MAAIDFEVEVTGDKEIERAFAALTKEVATPDRLWAPLNSVLDASTGRNFNSQGAQSGGWRALSPAYAKLKAVKYPGQPIMRATGALYRSLTDAFDSNAIFISRPTEMIRGTRLPYAKHAAARRPIFAVTDADKTEMERQARLSFADFTKQLGFEVI